MRVAMEDLRLDELRLICSGKISALIGEGISIHGIETLCLRNGSTACSSIGDTVRNGGRKLVAPHRVEVRKNGIAGSSVGAG